MLLRYEYFFFVLHPHSIKSHTSNERVVMETMHFHITVMD